MKRSSRVAATLAALLSAFVATACGDPPAPAAPVAQRPAEPAVRLVPPLADTEPGERLVLGFGQDEFDYLVTSSHEDRVQIEFMKNVAGAPAGNAPVVEVWNRNAWGIPAESVVRRIEFAVEIVHGRAWPCWKLFVYNAQGQRRYYITDELPANGLLKAVRMVKGREEGELALVALRDSGGTLERAKAGELADALLPGTHVLEPPLHDAEQGEQIVLRLGSKEYVYRVVRAGRLSVDVEISERKVGGALGEPLRTDSWDRNLFGVDAGAVIESFEPDRIQVADTSWECWKMTVRTQEGRLAYWISHQLPVHGALRVAPIVDGEPDLTRAYQLAPND